MPTYDGPFRNEPVAPAGDLPPTQALPKQDQPTYRVRDYAPAAFAPAPTWTAEPVAPTDLEYHTEARIPEAPIQAPPVAPAPAHELPAQTLTRRELRAMLHTDAEDEALEAPVDLAPVDLAPVAAPRDRSADHRGARRRCAARGRAD